MNGETNPMANDGGERREGMTHAEDVYKLDIEEYLKTIRIPDSQRVYTGSDSAWTRLVNRSGRSLLEQVQTFVEELRPSRGHKEPVMTPANQRVRNMYAIEPIDKGRRGRNEIVLKGDENNSSINTSPVLGNDKVSRGNKPSTKNLSHPQTTTVHASKDTIKPAESAEAAIVGSSQIQRPEEGIDKVVSTHVGHGQHRRKSLKNPIDTETKKTLDKMKNDIEMRKMPPVATQKNDIDAIQGARQYLVSRSSLGSPKEGLSDLLSIGSENDNPPDLHLTQDLDILDSEKRKKASVEHGRSWEKYPGGDDVLKGAQKNKKMIDLPPHLQELKERIKKMRYSRSASKDTAKMRPDRPKPLLDLSGLKMAQDFDPRRMPMDFVDSGKVPYTDRNFRK